MSGEASDKLTQQAREGVRRVPWKTMLAGAGGTSIIALLAVSGFGPPIASGVVGWAAQGEAGP